jgi:hypothetical protein
MANKEICKKVTPEQISKRTIRMLWGFLVVTLIATIVAEFFLDKKKVHFAIEEYSLFYAVFGFLACFAIIFISKFLGYIVKREENYYDREEEL